MKKDAEIKVRVSSELKEEAAALYENLGLSMSAAIELFLRASLRDEGLPFSLKVKPKIFKGRIAENGDVILPKEWDEDE